MRGRAGGAERERDDLRAERDASAFRARHDLLGRRRAIATERDAIAAQRDEVAAQRDELAALVPSRPASATTWQHSGMSWPSAWPRRPRRPRRHSPRRTRHSPSGHTRPRPRPSASGAESRVHRRSSRWRFASSSHCATSASAPGATGRPGRRACRRLHNRESDEVTRAELQAAQTELDDARTELRTLRAEEQRATMLEDELRAARAELDSVTGVAETRRVGGARNRVREQGARRPRGVPGADRRVGRTAPGRPGRARPKLATRLAAVEGAAEAKVDASARSWPIATPATARGGAGRRGGREEATVSARTSRARASSWTRPSQRLLNETNNVREPGEKADFMQREAGDASARAERLAEELDDATQSNADINRRLQELEARRGARDRGHRRPRRPRRAAARHPGASRRPDRETHRRGGPSTARTRAAAPGSTRSTRSEGELRHAQMAQAMRQIRGEEPPRARPTKPCAVGEAAPLEDRRATSPFMKELSLDARKSLTRILGHHADPQAQEGREGAGAAGPSVHGPHPASGARGRRDMGDADNPRARHDRAHGPPHRSRGAGPPRRRGVRCRRRPRGP